MNPERWQKISQAFDAVLQADPASRELVLQQACAGDPELRAEVERLLACDAEVRAEGFLSFLDRRGAAGVTDWLPGNLTGPGPRPNGTHVLDSIAATIGTVPRVLLRDTTPNETPSPLVKSSSPEMPDGSARLQLFGEIARGGMGVILKGRDPDLGRELAVKVLLEQHRHNPDLVRRFIEEAQIGGQLQHPGIVPVYELGQFADTRPYFSMKLVKGRTLAEVLDARTDPRQDLSAHLATWLQVCQTVAYAHARGVIHRDLKPSNVMLGSFGEVQVMDWGLAKVLARGGVVDDATAGKPSLGETLIETARSGESGSDTDLSRAGSVMGTPSYMAPEQARGETDLLDERADVFALGSILCEILTGKPAFQGQTSAEIQRKAARGDSADALARLDACGADAELIALTKDCLAVNVDDRPRHAGDLAGRITSYLDGVQQKLRETELERARAEAKATAERSRRRLTMALAATVLLACGLGAAGWRKVELDRIGRESTLTARVNSALQEATQLRGRAQAAGVGNLAPWIEATAAAKKAVALLEPEIDPALREQAGKLLAEVTAGQIQAKAEILAAERDRHLLDQLVDIRSAEADDDPEGSATDAAYAQAFREAGIALVLPPLRRSTVGGSSDPFRDAGIDPATDLPPHQLGAKIRERPPAVALAIAAALDDWAAVRRGNWVNTDATKRLFEAAQAADPDPWRCDLRLALEQPRKEKRLSSLHALASSARFDELGPISLNLLGRALLATGDPTEAERVLRAAQRRYPGDVWVNYNLARALERLGRFDEAIRYYTAARAIQPETAHDLAHMLGKHGEPDEAIAIFQDLVRLRPKNGRHRVCLSVRLKAQGRTKEADTLLTTAVEILREAIARKPDNAEVHYTLGNALSEQGKLDEAIAEFRAAIRLRPDYDKAHHNLGHALATQGKTDEAIAEFRETIRLDPTQSRPHYGLGIALGTQGKHAEAAAEFREAIRLQPDLVEAHDKLAIALEAQGKHDEAIAESREAIRLDPAQPSHHYGLGNALKVQGKLDEAIAEYHEAIRLKPDFYQAHNNLGNALHTQGKLDEAAEEFREAFRLKPDLVEAHYNLGNDLRDQGKLDEAIDQYREAIRLQPDYVKAHHNLGRALDAQGKHAEASNEYREVLRLDPDHTQARSDLGNAPVGQRKAIDAIAKYREAIWLKPDDALPHFGLGIGLQAQGKPDEAIAEYREAIRLKPDYFQARRRLGNALRDQGKYDEAIAESHEAIQLKPDDPQAHFDLAYALDILGKLDEAIAEYRELIRLRPKVSLGFYNMGNALFFQGKLDEANAAYRQAIRIEPDHFGAHWNLGRLLRDQGDYTGSLAMLRKGHELTLKRPSLSLERAQIVVEAERMVALADRFSALLKGEDQPKDRLDRLALAQMCSATKHHAAAARFWTEALAAARASANDLAAAHLDEAAFDAALAAAGKTADDPPTDEDAKAKLRTQAHDWLRADLNLVLKPLLSGPGAAHANALWKLRRWKIQPALAGVRDPEALARLPEAERRAWQTLWADVDAVLQRVDGKSSK